MLCRELETGSFFVVAGLMDAARRHGGPRAPRVSNS